MRCVVFIGKSRVEQYVVEIEVVGQSDRKSSDPGKGAAVVDDIKKAR